MKPLLPNWLAGALIAGFLFLGAYLGGPDEVESAQATQDVIDETAARLMAAKEK